MGGICFRTLFPSLGTGNTYMGILGTAPLAPPADGTSGTVSEATGPGHVVSTCVCVPCACVFLRQCQNVCANSSFSRPCVRGGFPVCNFHSHAGSAPGPSGRRGEGSGRYRVRAGVNSRAIPIGRFRKLLQNTFPALEKRICSNRGTQRIKSASDKIRGYRGRGGTCLKQN